MDKKELPLQTKYRPKTFEEFLGNGAVVRGLKTLLAKREGMPHAFLFTGPSGAGKTTLARILAAELKCVDSEFYELNTANTRGIDTVREIIDGAAYEPLLGDVKVYLFDECHMLTKEGQEALLKFLEDTPPHVFVVLCTTEPEKLNTTTKNRCSQWTVELLKEGLLVKLLDRVLAGENKTVDPQVKESIAIVADGCPRQALQILGQVIDIPDMFTQLQLILNVSVDEKIDNIAKALLNKAAWVYIVPTLGSIEKDKTETVRLGVLHYFTAVLLNPNTAPSERDRLSKMIEAFSQPFFNAPKPGLVQACFKALKVG